MKGPTAVTKNPLRSLLRPLSGTLLPRVAYPVLRGPLRGARFVLGSLAGEGGGASAYLNLVEPEKTAALIDVLQEGGVFLDIGANVGYYSILASRLLGPRGRVIAFEPLMTNLSYLYRHVRLNRADNVLIVGAACSDVHSIEEFRGGANRALGHLQSPDPSGGPARPDSMIVPTVMVDAVVQKLGVSPTVLKIDAEGAEVTVLRGAEATISRWKPIVFLEVHSDALRSACTDFLGRYGYAFKTLVRDETASIEDLVAVPAARPEES